MAGSRVIAVTPGSPAAAAGICVGDELLTINGETPRDVIAYQLLIDEADPVLEVDRGGLARTVEVAKAAGEPMGLDVESAIFDAVRTCDNHCEFCFIYQLPKGLRPSLYQKDDDFRLSFLYGNFTTLTRFTESDLERVVTERLSPLYVSIHATDPDVRAAMLRNRRGATSLRWLRALLDHDITVHGQVVVCPGVNDGAVLDDTLCGIADQFPDIASVGVVPLGVSRYSNEAAMRPHTRNEIEAVIELVEGWQRRFYDVFGRRIVFLADEYYVLAGRPVPDIDAYEDLAQHENGIGIAAVFAAEFAGTRNEPLGPRSGFFSWVDGAPASGYRAERLWPQRRAHSGSHRHNTVVLTGSYGAALLRPLLHGRAAVDVLEVPNHYFGGNVGVAGLMVGVDVANALGAVTRDARVLLPDVCLSGGRFLDGMSLADLPREVEVVATDGISLRRALEGEPAGAAIAAGTASPARTATSANTSRTA